MSDFPFYLEALAGSWEALAAPHTDARVVRSAGFIAARFPDHPVLDNAVLMSPDALGQVRSLYADARAGYAIWSLEPDTAIARALEAAGFRRDITTEAMVYRLDRLAPATAAEQAATTVSIARDVDSAVVADLNGVPGALLDGVPGLRAYATSDHNAGLIVIPVGKHINVSFVATRAASRRRGLASAVTAVALLDGRTAGFSTASLQATPMAERLYTRLGFEAVGRWQEWVSG